MKTNGVIEEVRHQLWHQVWDQAEDGIGRLVWANVDIMVWEQVHRQVEECVSFKIAQQVREVEHE